MARYHDLAEALRVQITAGALAPGSVLPSANKLAWEHGVGRDTALKALALLRGEGLLFRAPDNAIRVGPARFRQTRDDSTRMPEIVDVPESAMVRARMPTPKERDELRLAEGIPVLVIRIGDDEEIHAADSTCMRWR